MGGREGLGVRSMEERAYLLGGQFEIHSKPGRGTRIEVSVPLQPKTAAPTAGSQIRNR
jgi:signal transduction histidine kinase